VSPQDFPRGMWFDLFVIHRWFCVHAHVCAHVCRWCTIQTPTYTASLGGVVVGGWGVIGMWHKLQLRKI
jgi:hypothetical protein